MSRSLKRKSGRCLLRNALGVIRARANRHRQTWLSTPELRYSGAVTRDPRRPRGDPASSRILQALRYQGPQMPPSGKLPGEQIALIEQWIAKGLPWPAESAAAPAPADATKALAAKRWAWEPLHASSPPEVRTAASAPTTIDRFIHAKIDPLNLKPAAAADRRTLLR